MLMSLPSSSVAAAHEVLSVLSWAPSLLPFANHAPPVHEVLLAVIVVSNARRERIHRVWEPVSANAVRPCPKGTFSFAGASSCTSCNAGTFADFASSASCKRCPAGTFSVAIRAQSSASVCTRCNPGQYADQPGSRFCKRCPPGTLSLAIGAQSADVIDVMRDSMRIQLVPRLASCVPQAHLGLLWALYLLLLVSSVQRGQPATVPGSPACLPCPAGTKGSLVGAQSPAACKPCPMGTFSGQRSVKCNRCPQVPQLAQNLHLHASHVEKERSAMCRLEQMGPSNARDAFLASTQIRLEADSVRTVRQVRSVLRLAPSQHLRASLARKERLAMPELQNVRGATPIHSLISLVQISANDARLEHSASSLGLSPFLLANLVQREPLVMSMLQDALVVMLVRMQISEALGSARTAPPVHSVLSSALFP
ncbi:Tyrosine-protein kinase ephrin type A/B receptor-like protein [Gracilaria domingensis]|nr:Tyrosine-protein kinase ephrin type A/B receptor-like protein [Gracilaria domingensis]